MMISGWVSIGYKNRVIIEEFSCRLKDWSVLGDTNRDTSLINTDYISTSPDSDQRRDEMNNNKEFGPTFTSLRKKIIRRWSKKNQENRTSVSHLVLAMCWSEIMH